MFILWPGAEDSDLLGKGELSVLEDIVLVGGLYTVKKRITIFPSQDGMPMTKHSLAGNNKNYSRPGRVWLVTSRLGKGK